MATGKYSTLRTLGGEFGWNGPARSNWLDGSNTTVVRCGPPAGCVTEFEQRYAVAEELRQEAATRGYEWIETSALLEEAQQEAADGNTDAALELVEAARFQANAALQQAKHEEEAWQQRVVK